MRPDAIPILRDALPTGVVEAGPAPRRFAETLARSLREHVLLLGLVALHSGALAAMPLILGRPLRYAMTFSTVAEPILTLVLWATILALSIGFLRAGIRRRHGRPYRSAVRWLQDVALRSDRVAGGLIVVLLLPVFGWNFACMKALIPLLNTEVWDAPLARWDRALHFGHQPWEWLQPVLGQPAITAALSLAYAGWFLVLNGVNTWQALAVGHRETRMQYLLSTLLLWILLGNVAGTLMASAGPVYFGRATGLPDPFAPLVQYLDGAGRQWPILAREIQEKIWLPHVATVQGGIAGNLIAAMPSLHVATAASFYLVARATLGRLAWVFALYLAVILLGSVHLGWHYALDSYAGLAGALLLWRFSGWLVRRPPVMRLLWGEPVRNATLAAAPAADPEPAIS